MHLFFRWKQVGDIQILNCQQYIKDQCRSSHRSWRGASSMVLEKVSKIVPNIKFSWSFPQTRSLQKISRLSWTERVTNYYLKQKRIKSPVKLLRSVRCRVLPQNAPSWMFGRVLKTPKQSITFRSYITLSFFSYPLTHSFLLKDNSEMQSVTLPFVWCNKKPRLFIAWLSTILKTLNHMVKILWYSLPEINCFSDSVSRLFRKKQKQLSRNLLSNTFNIAALQKFHSVGNSIVGIFGKFSGQPFYDRLFEYDRHVQNPIKDLRWSFSWK